MLKFTKRRKNIIFAACVYLLILLYISFVGQRVVVEGESMSPTYHDGQNLYMNKLTRLSNDYNRFDIITFKVKDLNPSVLIKRIIGLPGETVKIDSNGNIFINDMLLDESFGLEPITTGTNIEVSLGSDEFFVMGDNRNHSIDSRFVEVGPVNKKNIMGRIVKKTK